MNKNLLVLFGVLWAVFVFNVVSVSTATGQKTSRPALVTTGSAVQAAVKTGSVATKTVDRKPNINKAEERKRANVQTPVPVAKVQSTPVLKNGGPNIRVRLATISGEGALKMERAGFVKTEKGSVITKVKENDTIKFSRRGADIYVNGKKAGSTVLIDAESVKEENSFLFQNRRYRGGVKITAHRDMQGVLVINELPLESYLYGVVPKEIIPSWPKPVLLAQAVAARTYALHKMEKNKASMYDVESTVWSQVYEGKDGEFPDTTVAVDETKGLVMYYGKTLIDALFHADGGGYTESSHAVWGNDVPYLRAVKDFSTNKNTYEWTVKTTRENLEQALRGAGKDVGTLKEIKLSALRKRPMKVSDRGESGRIISLVAVGTKRSLTIPGTSLQSILGLRSTLFDIYIDHNPKEDVDQIKSDKTWHTFGKGNQVIYIKGYGWGHGLGLSQWGAAAMAKTAKASEKDFYMTILKHYYHGITLKKIY